MLSAVRTTAYSVIAVGGRRSGASRCAATPRPRPLLEHFSLNQLCQLDATAYEPIHPALATARIVLAWRMSISSQAGAAVSRNVALGAVIGIGGHLAVPPLPHHRAYGSRTTAVRSG